MILAETPPLLPISRASITPFPEFEIAMEGAMGSFLL